MAGVVGLEPTLTVLETVVLPIELYPYSLNVNGGGGQIRTAEPDGSGFTVRRV